MRTLAADPSTKLGVTNAGSSQVGETRKPGGGVIERLTTWMEGPKDLDSADRDWVSLPEGMHISEKINPDRAYD